jgi:hypothetical protein
MNLNYDHKSPFTGEASVLEEPISATVSLMLCTDTGYHTYKGLWNDGSDDVTEAEKSMPAQFINTKKNADGYTWYYYTFVDVDNCVALLPDIKEESLVWNLYFLKPKTDESEVSIAKFETTEGVVEYVIDLSTREPFDTFADALDRYSYFVYRVNSIKNELEQNEGK